MNSEKLNGHEKMLLLFGWFVGSSSDQDRAMRGLINREFATGWGEPLTERGREARERVSATAQSGLSSVQEKIGE